MADLDIRDLKYRLGQQAEAVCRHYLSQGAREGNYWRVGDARNSPGRSMFVRLRGPESGRGAAGLWTDAATGEHGDLLDIIRASCGLASFADVIAEARAFLALPRQAPQVPHRRWQPPRSPSQSRGAARRLFSTAQPITGTLAETYLHGRGISDVSGMPALRFQPRCYFRPTGGMALELEPRPALIAAVTDLTGRMTGVHRTWLDPAGFSEATLGKAPIDAPRRAMGDLLGHAVRFGRAGEVMMAGEGIETVLSLRMALPQMPMMAALSATHLGAVLFPRALRRLYIARDADPAGNRAMEILVARAQSAGIDAIALTPRRGDFNEDIRLAGVESLRTAMRAQLTSCDAASFLSAVP